MPNYKKGPQGNMVHDYAKDWREMYSPPTPDGEIGTPGVKDRRDARDPEAVGAAFLSRNNGHGELPGFSL